MNYNFFHKNIAKKKYLSYTGKRELKFLYQRKLNNIWRT
ncbi:MAG: hypothetical protein K0S27_1488 [Gammaproteobacteria bacterium]|jgi:hypothetical protein|nr:hypothetical protein [Gammaproteobacteria bacterium]